MLEWWDSSNYEKSMTPNPLWMVTGKYENMKHHSTSHWENDKKVWWRTYNLRISVIKTAFSRDSSPSFNSKLLSYMIIDSGFKSNKECFLTPPPPSYNSLIPWKDWGWSCQLEIKIWKSPPLCRRLLLKIGLNPDLEVKLEVEMTAGRRINNSGY